MAVTVEFLSLPIVTKILGSKTIEIDFTGQTVEELILEITQTYGGNFYWARMVGWT